MHRDHFKWPSCKDNNDKTEKHPPERSALQTRNDMVVVKRLQYGISHRLHHVQSLVRRAINISDGELD